ncbi:hypothetical protein [Epilithonimonas zeae]|uniref:hypothetical protein n=1 Tax=Epilithonimonas zeae TaxID=1416779 RepID=UPI00200C47F5|nr:hypothetical protein [Epilithonimonas zeae]
MQETGFYAFKWRNYMPDVGRFFNVDPLAEKFPYNSTYAFSENRVIDAREFEGLEKVQINKETKNLIIAVIGYRGPPEKGRTQVKNDPNISYDKTSFAHKLVESYASDKNTQVAVFFPSTTSYTDNDISASIQDFRAQSPDGKLVLAGHSKGADTVVGVANDNPDIKVDKLLTLDISSFTVNNTKIKSNTAEAKNYYQDNFFDLGGTRISPADGNTTSKVTNVNTTSSHTTIDDDYRINILNEVKKVIPIKK